MRRHWIAVASADHVRLGRAGGFMQVAHGKAAPLRRIHPGDRVAYYSPTEAYGRPGKLQCFTAIGTVRAGEPFAHDMGGGFVPARRDVDWCAAPEVSILPLLEKLEFSAGRRHWGAGLRFGLLEVTAHDMAVIAEAMGADLPS